MNFRPFATMALTALGFGCLCSKFQPVKVIGKKARISHCSFVNRITGHQVATVFRLDWNIDESFPSSVSRVRITEMVR
jgi:hypothetical protein